LRDESEIQKTKPEQIFQADCTMLSPNNFHRPASFGLKF